MTKKFMKQRHEAEDVVESINEELSNNGLDDVILTYVSSGISCKISFGDCTLWCSEDDPRELMSDDIKEELEYYIWKQFAEVIGKLNKIRKIKMCQL